MCINDDILISMSDVEDKISSYNEAITYQKREIENTKTIVLEFKNCLKRQNDSLKKFIEEKEILNEFLYKINNDNERLKYKRQKLDNEDSEKRNEFGDKNARSVSQITLNDAATNLLNTPNVDTNDKDVLVAQQIGNLKLLSPLLIPEINGRTINAINMFNNSLYICGSNGMLIRNCNQDSFIFDTGTKEDIVQIMVLRVNKRISLVAFTAASMIVYEDINFASIHKDQVMSGIGSASVDNGLIYIPMKQGVIKKFNFGRASFGNLPILKKEDVDCFINNVNRDSFCFVLFKNSMLYAVLKNKEMYFIDNSVKPIPCIKGVAKIGQSHILYYNKNTLWVTYGKLENHGEVKFKNGIKMVASSPVWLAVVDNANVLYVYNFNSINGLGSILWTKEISQNVTSIIVAMQNKIYLSYGSTVAAL